jgi:hypothetical protein
MERKRKRYYYALIGRSNSPYGGGYGLKQHTCPSNGALGQYPNW